MDQIEVRVVFEKSHPDHGLYRDALVMPLDEYEKATEKELDVVKQERFDNWVTALENPPEPEPVDEPTALEQIKEAITQAQTGLAQALDAVNAAEG